jgi:hypothetical protein
MALERWRPRTGYTKQEQVLRHRLTRTGKLFGFLRDYRQELFDDEFKPSLSRCTETAALGVSQCHPRCWRWRSFCRRMKAYPTPRR